MQAKRTALAFIAAGTLGLPVAVYAYTGSQYEKNAKVTLSEARSKAVQTVPGTIQSAELEKEPGGSGLRYSFDIKTHNGLREVGIDANTGKVLENRSESAKREGQERKNQLSTQPPY